MTNYRWRPAPIHCDLEENEVHVWRATLDVVDTQLDNFRCILSSDELCRADQFFFARDRRRFILARGLLRIMLGRYLAIEPSQVHFNYTDYGKPVIDPLLNHRQLNFNLSHSDDLVLYAFTRNKKIGIDLEKVRYEIEYEQIAQRFFSSFENSVLHSLPSELRPVAFFNCWTRKEAYIKARGEGLSLPLNQFDVSLIPNAPAKLLQTSFDPNEVSHWTLFEIIPRPGYVAALAIKGFSSQLTYWQW